MYQGKIVRAAVMIQQDKLVWAVVGEAREASIDTYRDVEPMWSDLFGPLPPYVGPWHMDVKLHFIEPHTVQQRVDVEDIFSGWQPSGAPDAGHRMQELP